MLPLRANFQNTETRISIPVSRKRVKDLSMTLNDQHNESKKDGMRIQHLSK